MPGRHGTVEERFWRYVDKTSNGCWLWMGSRQPKGYGRLQVAGRVELAHRVAYDLLVGPIPPGMTLDHLCRVESCVNPGHLEVVTAAENFARGPGATKGGPCGRGHDPTRRLYRANGWFAYCRDCRNDQRRERYNTDAAYRRATLDGQRAGRTGHDGDAASGARR